MIVSLEDVECASVAHESGLVLIVVIDAASAVEAILTETLSA
jgi:hypothetical protein